MQRWPSCRKEWIHTTRNTVDCSDPGELNDFLNCIFQVSQKDDSQLAIQNAFAAFDKDDTGYVGVHELKHVLSKFGEPLKENEVRSYH